MEAAKFETSSNESNEVSSNENKDEENWISRVFKKRKISNLENEIRNYLAEDMIGESEKPLMYWNLKKNIYTSLSSMARKYLSVPSTSTPSERAFSSGRLTIPHTRASLSPEKICALMCPNNWYANGFI